MPTEPSLSVDGFNWKQLRRYYQNQTLVPVLGPGVITFGPEDTPLYKHLCRELAGEFGMTNEPDSLAALAREVRRRDGLRGERRIRSALVDLMEPLRKEAPSPLMAEVASLMNCQTYFTLACDTLLEVALEQVRGRPPLRWNSLKCAGADLPEGNSERCSVGYLFGEVSAEPGHTFNLWDADAIECALSLQRQRDNKGGFPHLETALTSKHLLFVGADMSDWALRFLLRIIRGTELSHDTNQELFLTERDDGRSDDPVAFFNVVSSTIHFQHDNDPVSFMRRLCRELSAAGEGVSIPSSGVNQAKKAARPSGPVFVSYVHEDKAAARRIVDRLRAENIEVWFDENDLRVGNNLPDKVTDAIRSCSAMVSVISNTSEDRVMTGSFVKLERLLALDRAKMMDPGFYLPVVIDAGLHRTSFFPSDFHSKSGFLSHEAIVHYAIGGEVDGKFLEDLKTLFRS